LDFIKSSQRFYRGYVQHLSSHFGGIVELDKVARKFNYESAQFPGSSRVDSHSADSVLYLDLSGQAPSIVAPDVRKRILQSCHATLIRLGDLSRYRETELVAKDRNWGPAIGYYDLASVIYPVSGASHNQLAVIALADGNHLRATYHLYRALSAHDPHPSAKGNLEIEFRKVMNLWAKRELIRPEDAGIPGRALAPWFVYLHAQCYRGNDFPEHDELESEVMSQLAVDIRERSLEGTLQKLCLINIAAEDFARTRSTEESVSNARSFFQRINVKTFFTLLQILLVELERFAAEDSSTSSIDTPKNGPDKLTVVARRILPALRHYSSWLLTTSNFLVAQKEEKDSTLSIQIQEFWKIYAGTLTLLASTFDVVHLPEIDYLLEEDEESLGFAPLDQPATSRRYVGVGERIKPRVNDPGVERSHPNEEMLYRIREFVIDGLDLVVRNKIPVVLVDAEDKKTFIYQEDGLPSQFFSSPHGRQHTLPTPNIERDEIPRLTQGSNSTAEGRSMFGGSQSASVSASASMSANMHGIVEGVERLVESDTYENSPAISNHFSYFNDTGEMPTPSARMVSSTNAFPLNETPQQLRTPIAPPGLGPPVVNTADSLRGSVSQGYGTLPALPSIWNTSSPGPLRDAHSPRTPPGLGGQSPMHAVGPTGIKSSERSPSQDQIAKDLPRYSLMGQPQLSNSIDAAGSIPSSWIPPSNLSATQPRPTGNSWDHDLGRMTFGSYELPSQSMSNGMTGETWANEAFIASSLASGAGHYNSGFSHRKPGTQLGAIGQTPPCGQGG